MSVTEASAPPPAAGSFYVTGGTLPFDAASYVPRQADHDLLDGLTQGEFCYVLNTRQMGKSSLMIRTAHHLRQQGDTVAVLDLTAVGQNLTPEQWYDGLLMSLAEQLHLEDALEDFWEENTNLGPLQRFITAVGKVVLPRIPQRLILFVDEIDAVRSLPFPADEFFAAIRECYNRRRLDPVYEKLAFCLLGVATPADLIQDTRMSPFNIGRRILLTDFTPIEAAPLARGLGGGAAVLGRVLYWTNGHPYMTQRLCRAIAEEPAEVTAGQVDALCARLFLTKQARDTDDNLAFVRNRLLRSEVDLAALLDLYQQVRGGKKVKDDETNPLVPVLRLSGVVNAPEGLLRVRNRVYDRVFDKDWVQAHMPDAELRRQKEAYRRGVLRTAAVFTAVLLMMGVLAASSLLNARLAEKATHTAREQTRIADAKTEDAYREKQVAERNAVLAAQRADALREANRQKEIANKHSFLAAAQAVAQARVAMVKSIEAQRNATVAVLQQRRADASAAQNKQLAAQSQRALESALTSKRLSNHYQYAGDMSLIQSEYDNHNTNDVVRILQVTRSLPDRGFEWGYWDRLCHLNLLRTFRGHTGFVQSAVFSPDGQRIVTAGSDSTARVWDVRSGAVLLTLRGHTGPIYSAAFSPDGQRIVTGGGDGTARIWNAHTGANLLTLRGNSEKVWSRFPSIFSASFSPDGTRIVTSSDDTTARLWDAKTGAPLLTLRGHTEQVYSASFSPDGTRIATSSRDGTAKVWDAKTGASLRTLQGHTDSVVSAGFSPDGRRIVTASGDETARVWDAETGAALVTLRGHTGTVMSAAYSPDGRRIVTAGGDKTVRLWDAQADRQVVTLRGHTDGVWSADFSPDGSRIVTAGLDKTARVWDAHTGASLLTLRGHTDDIYAAVFSPGGTRILTASQDNTARIWDAKTGASLVTLQDHVHHFWSAAFSPDGRRVVTANSDFTPHVWDAGSGAVLLTLRGHTDLVRSAAFSPDGTRIVSTSDDTTARVWDAKTGTPLLTLRGHTGSVRSAAFSPDSRRIVTAGLDSTARVWDAKTGADLLTLRGHTGRIYSASFSPDGQRIVTASDDKTARLWDAHTGITLLTLPGPSTGGVYSAAFSPDGTRIVTTDSDGTAEVWFSDLGPAGTAPEREKQQQRLKLAREQEQADAKALLNQKQADARSLLRDVESRRVPGYANASRANLLPAAVNPTRWALVLQPGGPTMAVLRTAPDGTATVTVTRVDGSDWHVMVYQYHLPLTPRHRYLLQMRARAAVPVTIRLNTENDTGNDHNGLEGTLALTPQWQAFRLPFTLGNSVGTSALSVSVGQGLNTIQFADAVLVPDKGQASDPNTTQAPAVPLEAAGYNAGLIAGGQYDASSQDAALASIRRTTTSSLSG